MKQHIAIIGPRCVGKTNTGLYLAKALNAEFIDADPLIEQREGKTIKQIVEEKGWKYFRKLESELISEVTSNSAGKNIVFAVGGGAVAHEYENLRVQNVKFLRQFGTVILLMPSESLEESARIIYKRMQADKKSATQRPSLTGLSQQEETINILKKRMPFYMKAKNLVIYAKGLNEKEVAQKIIYEFKFY